MADTIASARRHRGAVCSRLTQIKRDIVKLEDQGLTPFDQRKIKHLKEQAKEMTVILSNVSFEAEYKAALDSEEAFFDEHVNCVSDII